MSCSISDRHVFFGSTSRDAPADFFSAIMFIYIYICNISRELRTVCLMLLSWLSLLFFTPKENN